VLIVLVMGTMVSGDVPARTRRRGAMLWWLHEVKANNGLGV